MKIVIGVPGTDPYREKFTRKIELSCSEDDNGVVSFQITKEAILDLILLAQQSGLDIHIKAPYNE